MPTPDTATQGSQSENADASAKTTPDNKQTTTQPRAQENLMDFLDVPKEVRAQITPKTVEPMTGDIPPEHPKGEASDIDALQGQQAESQASDTDALQEQHKEEPPDDDDDDDDAGQQSAERDEGVASTKIDKRQKRINRLTRKLSERDSTIDTLVQQLDEFKGKLTKQRGDKESSPVPSSSGWLPNIASEQQLNQEVTKARSLIQWCNENADGVTTGEGENQKFVSPKEISGWKSEAEMMLVGSEPRRRELREYSGLRNHFDGIARQAWPELFDERSEEYQLAQSLIGSNPELRSRADGNYALGLLVEGAKSLNARVQAAAKNVAGNGNATGASRPRDIDPRAFAPRVPLAPSGPDIPTREVVPSSHKKLNQAMDQLVADTDGSVSSLANALAALDETKRTRAGSRTPVKV